MMAMVLGRAMEMVVVVIVTMTTMTGLCDD